MDEFVQTSATHHWNRGFFRGVFSEDNGIGSFGRLACIPTIAAACFCLLFLTIRNHALPDALIIGALGAFAVAPYGTNKITGAIASRQ